MEPLILWHNPRCSKSRQTLELLQSKGQKPQIFEYLKEPLTPELLSNLLNRLGLTARQLMRTKEEAYANLNLADPAHSEADLIQAMIQHPILIERPILVKGSQAAIGRPPEQVLEIL